MHNDFERCIELNKKALLLSSGEPEKINSDIGIAMLKAGQIEEAISQLESTIKQSPGHADAYINLGLCFKAQFDHTRALSSFENALKLSPNDPRIYSNIGGILYADGKYDDAVVNYLRALEYEPDDAEVLSNLGMALIKINLV